ncbi:cytidine triphosphate synthetase [Hepatocystis sp. ex Piliocolobus tephrosceles]|nr:cytidine triphosphate synthetase [Hepatocystis sp. ex Piliocolobus tephrosceles]
MSSADSENVVTKYIIVTGGNMSGLGKGTAMSSIGVLLLTKNILLTTIKIDPYLNVDAGTMSPYEHGEVYVLEDGGEVDLDLGNYERFLNVKLTHKNNITSGKIYEEVIKRERKGEYLGKTVQVVPHVTNVIKKWIKDVIDESIKKMKKEYNIINSVNKVPCICLIEVGGTVGDIESAVYLEALQQLTNNLNHDDVCLCHLSYLPIIGNLKEQKTKPTQHSVKILREAGLKPDFIFCRCEEPLSDEAIQKISLFSQVKKEHVISLHDTSNVYKVPLILEQQNFSSNVLKKLNLLNITLKNKIQISPYSFNTWKHLCDRYESSTEPVVIGIVGKYTASNDTYLSIISALVHACIQCGYKLIIKYINSSHLSLKKKSKKKYINAKKKANKYSYETGSEINSTRKQLFVDDTTSDEDYDKKRRIKYMQAWKTLKSVDGVLVPGGFGTRGIEGKYLSSKYCRIKNIPYLGICLGMQIAVIDVTREYLNKYANSEEFEDVIDLQNNSDKEQHLYDSSDDNNNIDNKNKKKRQFVSDNLDNENVNNCDKKKVQWNALTNEIEQTRTDEHKLFNHIENGIIHNNTLTNHINISSSITNTNDSYENQNVQNYNEKICTKSESEWTHMEDFEYYDRDTKYMYNNTNSLSNNNTNHLTHIQQCIDDIPKKMQDPLFQEKIKLLGIQKYYKSINEIDNNNVIVSMVEFKGEETKGGTMRLGLKQSKIVDKESLTYKAYDEAAHIFERHRHRFEINPQYVPLLEAVGLSFVAKDVDSVRMEICEIKKLDFFVGVQFHPEFTSRPFKANPIFLAFILSSKRKLKEHLKQFNNKLCSGNIYK